jgi:hypothetical protein
MTKIDIERVHVKPPSMSFPAWDMSRFKAHR